jgi:vitamin K-dependent gamma-carboxylase
MLGQPMGMFMSTKTDIPVIGSLVSWQSIGIAMSWFGLLFDLFIVPALLWRKTRVAAYIACIAFHLINSVLFQIHVFPWFMIVATTIYFDPAWPRRLLTVGRAEPIPDVAEVTYKQSGHRPRPTVLVVVCAYLLFQCLWPLRSRLYGNEPSWDERGHLFSWRMMLRAKEVGLGYAIVDPETGRVANVDHKRFIDAEQSEKFGRDPELILLMAHFIANRFESEMGRRPQVYAFVLASLNGRKAQLMIDPNVDLAAEPRGQLGRRAWVMPLTESLRREPWIVPVEQWRQYVELPEIEFLKKTAIQPAS